MKERAVPVAVGQIYRGRTSGSIYAVVAADPDVEGLWSIRRGPNGRAFASRLSPDAYDLVSGSPALPEPPKAPPSRPRPKAPRPTPPAILALWPLQAPGRGW